MFRKTALFLLGTLMLLNLTGCTAIKRMVLNHRVAVVEEEQQVYFADPNHDLIQEMESSGLANLEFVAKQVEYLMAGVLLSQGNDHDTLLVIFHEAISSPELKTAKDRYLGFVRSEKLKNFIMPKLWAKDEYSGLTDEQKALIDSVLSQYFYDKLNGEDDPEKYAQSIIDIFLNNS